MPIVTLGSSTASSDHRSWLTLTFPSQHGTWTDRNKRPSRAWWPMLTPRLTNTNFELAGRSQTATCIDIATLAQL